MKKDFNCYDCMWSSDRCKNPEADNYDNFLETIHGCEIINKKVDNSPGSSWNNLKYE